MAEYKFLLRNSIDAIKWFKAKVQNLNKANSKELKIEEKSAENRLQETTVQLDKFEVGKMYLFHYMPKGKDTLPYYDMYPLILLLDIHKKGFSGINLHYIPVQLRMTLLSNLLEKSVTKDGHLERLRISHDIIKNVSTFEAYKPCFKQYIFPCVKSAIKLIDPEDWAFAASMPLESFRKKSKGEVWKDSMDSIN